MAEKAVYTVAEVAALTGFSRATVTRIFERERGVLILWRPSPCTSGAIAASAYHGPCMSASWRDLLSDDAADIRQPSPMPCRRGKGATEKH